ncbi:MAG TPA: FAD-dependent oxidoreductase [Thiotrichales bacterium]|nr:FAD-dependent oxidoreductase [Thiotrichales bacterium]
MTETENKTITEVSVDVVIIGGGIAGLWSLARLRQAGYNAVLLEAEALGAGQTRYAQGIIHGGTKYALTGKLTASSEAVADMPSRWRACYEGKGELDLSQAELLSDAHYLWSTTSLTSRISGFFASKVMRSRSTELDKKSLPPVFQHKDFRGQFYRLDEPVFNTLSVIRAIAEPLKKNILMINAETLEPGEAMVRVEDRQGNVYAFHYSRVILMAGQGNEKLLERFGCHEPVMQRRPLKMVVMKKIPGNTTSKLDMIYAHCLGASVNPRITITSHRDSEDNVVWYMGGQLAEDGVNKTDAALIETAKKELNELIPWLDSSTAQWGVLAIDRAEIKKPGATRPDSFSIETSGRVVTAWPTKLALSPALADALLDVIEKETLKPGSDHSLPAWMPPAYADFPWNDAAIWRNHD